MDVKRSMEGKDRQLMMFLEEKEGNRMVPTPCLEKAWYLGMLLLELLGDAWKHCMFGHMLMMLEILMLHYLILHADDEDVHNDIYVVEIR